MNSAPVIVTRPARDAERWVRQLQQAGFGAEALPLIEIAALAHVAPAVALHGCSACLFVSTHAVEHFFQEKSVFTLYPRALSAINTIANQDFVKIPADLRFMAPGPGTAAALLSAGIAAAQIDAPAHDASQFDSEALWQVVGQRDWQGRRVLIVRGQSAGGSPARDWIARQWQAAGASVDFLSVYQRRAPLLNQAQIQRACAASADGSIWLFSSSEAVANLIGHAAMQGIDWSGARALATHPRIAQAARAAGWGVVAEARPALQDIGLALASIELRHS